MNCPVTTAKFDITTRNKFTKYYQCKKMFMLYLKGR